MQAATTLADLLATADSLAVQKMLQDERVKQGGRPVADLDVLGPQRYYAAGPLGEPAGWGGAGVLAPSGHFAVPTAIRRRLVDHQTNPFRTTEPPYLGLLPEISHGYLCLGPSLFLWRFDAGAAAAEAVLEFSEVDADISAVALVPPRPTPDGNFGASVDWLLVVATRDEVLLVAVDQADGNLRLTPTDFAIPTDNQDVTRGAVAGTATGRIFLGSSQGGLSEVSYSANEGWKEALGLRRAVRRQECGRAPMAFLVPAFLKQALSYGVPLVAIRADDCRHLLYTLNAKGFVELFYLGPTGVEEMTLVDRRSVFQLCEASAGDARRFFQAAGATDGHALVGLEVVPPYESKEVHAVATSSFGFRFFLSTAAPAYAGAPPQGPPSAAPGPTGLYLRSVRAPPGLPAFSRVIPPRADAELVQAGQTFGGAPPPFPQSALALANGALSLPGSATAPMEAAWEAVTPEDLDRAKKAAANGGSAYCQPPGAAAATVYYSKKTLLVVSPATARPGAPFPDNQIQRIYAVTEDSFLRPGGGGAAEEALTLVAGPANGELFNSVAALADLKRPAATLFTLSLASKVPEGHALKTKATAVEAAKYASLQAQKPAQPCVPNWLAHARAAPLHPSAAALWCPKRHLLALRCDPSGGGRDVGIAAFGFERPLDWVHNELLASGGAFAADSALRRLFDRLGHSEGCALAFAAACALPPDLGPLHAAPAGAAAAVPQGVAPGAAATAAAAAASPFALQARGGSLGGGALGLLGADVGDAAVAALANKALADPRHGGGGGGGHGFSPAVDGLFLFLGRLLRPLWYTPVVCLRLAPFAAAAPPAGFFRRGLDAKRARGEPTPLLPSARSVPPTVVPLGEVDRLRRVLTALAEVVGRVFGADLTQAVADLGAAAPDLPVPDFLAALAPHAQPASKPQPGEAAVKKDQAAALGAYALVHAATQALALVQVLGALHQDHAEAEVAWSALNGLTLGQLASDKATRKALSTALNDGGGKAALVKFKASPGAAELQARFYVDLAENCGFFFTEAVQLSQRAAQHVQDAKNYARHRNVPEAHAASERALEAYRAASAYWCSDDDVLGSRSKLKVAADALRSLRRPDGVVELCLRTASHFDDGGGGGGGGGEALPPRAAATGAGPLGLASAGVGVGVLARDRWLARLARDAPLADRAARQQITASCWMAAVGEVHALLDASQVYPDAAAPLPLRDRQRKADACIAHALRGSAGGGGGGGGYPSAGFQDMLYGMLRDEGHRQRLIAVPSPRVEAYLWRVGDEELLLDHLHQMGRYADAVVLARTLALSPDPLPALAGRARPLDARPSVGGALPSGVLSRLQCLDLAVRSARAAVERRDPGSDAPLSELREMHQRAAWQRAILTKLEARRDPEDWVSSGFDARRDWLPTPDQLHALRFGLIDDPSALFNDFAAKLNMWDDCLVILRDTNLNDERHIHLVWRQIVLQCLPRVARHCAEPHGAERLELVRDYVAYMCAGAGSAAAALQPDVARVSPAARFEDGAWLAELATCVGRTVRALRGGGPSGACFVVPLRSFLAKELEEATAHVLYAGGWAPEQGVQEDWVIDTLLAAGVPWEELYDAYAALVRARTSELSGLHYLRAFVSLVEKWASACERAAGLGASGAADLSLFKTVCRNPSNALHDLLTHVRSNATSISVEGHAVEAKEDLSRRVEALLRRPFINHMLAN